MMHGMTKASTYSYGVQTMDSSLLKEVQQGSGKRVDGSRRNQFGKEEASAGRRASTQRALGYM